MYLLPIRGVTHINWNHQTCHKYVGCGHQTQTWVIIYDLKKRKGHMQFPHI
jgi:hypothetical protein